MAWWPRHTPSTGTPASAKVRIASTDTPASAGVHGPGDTTTLSGARPTRSVVAAASLRTTSTSAPSSPRYWTRL